MKDPIVPLPPSSEKKPSKEDIEYEDRKYEELRELVADQLARLFVELAEYRQMKATGKKDSNSEES